VSTTKFHTHTKQQPNSLYILIFKFLDSNLEQKLRPVTLEGEKNGLEQASTLQLFFGNQYLSTICQCGAAVRLFNRDVNVVSLRTAVPQAVIHTIV